MRFGSVCSGIEAATVAWHDLGWRAAWLAEIDKFASAVLAHHYPDVPNLGDMTKIARAVLTGEICAPDVLCGGTPCQAFSVAGLRESLADARGNLTLKFVEIANAIDHVRTGRGEDECIVFWENVPGVLSTKDNAFGCFLAGLAGEDEPLVPPGQTPKPGEPWKWANAGAVYGPRRAIAWRTLDAQYFGVAQRRRRVFVVASARKEFDPAQVLFEWNGVRRDTAPSREAREAAAGSLTASAGRRGGVNDPERGQLISGTLQANGKAAGSATQQDAESGMLLPVQAFDASEDGTGSGTPLVPVAYATKLHNTASKQAGKFYENYTASLDANSPPPAIVFDTTQITSKANGSNPQPGDACYPLAAGAHAPAIAFPANLSGTQYASTEELAPSMGAANPTAVAVQASQSGVRINDTIGTLDANYGSRRHNGVMQDMQVRRLTPTECERLQGFPDGYTDIPWRTFQEASRKGISYETLLAHRGMTLRGPSVEECPDGPRYKALGNSWAIPNVAWIGRRIQAVLGTKSAAAENVPKPCA